jgi:pyrroloquinoline-quinone synthase
MTLDDFWTRVREELRKYDLLNHPFYQAWTSGRLTRPEIGYYGWQYLHHVAAFPTYLTALHCRLPEGETRRAVLANAAEEEAHDRPHSDLWRQFVGEIEPVKPERADAVLPEVKTLIETYSDLARHGSASAALGAFYAYESQVPLIAEEKLAGLRSFYGAGEVACEYFALHVTADLHHAHVWRRLIDHSIQENAACAGEALEGVSRGAQALWHALDGIDSARRSLGG